MNNHSRPNYGDTKSQSDRPAPKVEIKLFNSGDFTELIKTHAEEMAKQFNYERGTTLNKNSQIRNFYDELQRLLSKSDTTDFNKILPNIYIVASKCAYAKGRKTVGDTFFNFIKKNIDEIKIKEDLEKFLLYFEAVLGYYRFLNPSEN